MSIATLEKSQTQKVLTVVLPKEYLWLFLQKFGEHFAMECPELGRKVIRPVDSYQEDSRGGDTVIVCVKLFPEEVTAFGEFAFAFP